MDKVRTAILGLGNVGKGVWRILQENNEKITACSGCRIEVARILVRDMGKERAVLVPGGVITDDFEEIVKDDSIKVVIELMGGEVPAKEYMLRAIRAKKHVITANKLVLAKWGEELFKAASEEKVHIYYEASVGGGIPIIRGINESLTADRIEQIIGIINGTTNYILSKMTMEKASFEAALKEAQEKGYAEADPVSDIDGYDAAYKLSIISLLAFGAKIDPDAIFREGISSISTIDIEYASKFGYVIKLLAIAKDEDNKLELRVHPALVPVNHPIASVNGSFNAVFVKGNAVGDLMLYGRGAGDMPTGSAVVGDLISVLRNIAGPFSFNRAAKPQSSKKLKEAGENKPEFYIRLNVNDVAGTLGKISTIFGRNNISILSVTQEVKHDNNVSLVFFTHKAVEKNMKRSLERIEKLENVNRVESILRIENFN